MSSAPEVQPIPDSLAAVPRLAGRLLLRDEGLLRLTLFDADVGRILWQCPAPTGRDMQLLDGGRFLIGTELGWEERSLATGAVVRECAGFPGTIAAWRREDGITLLSRLLSPPSGPIQLLEVDPAYGVIRETQFVGFGYVRLVRSTAQGSYLITSNTQVFEGTPDGEILWRCRIVGHDEPHAWQAHRLPNGDTLVAAGYAASLQIFDAQGRLKQRIGGPAEVRPFFYSGLQLLPGGHVLVANWQGHGTDRGGSGVQLLEYAPNGDLAGWWRQPAEGFSSIQAALAVDRAGGL